MKIKTFIKYIIGVASVLTLFSTVAYAQNSSLWYYASGVLKPIIVSWKVLVGKAVPETPSSDIEVGSNTSYSSNVTQGGTATKAFISAVGTTTGGLGCSADDCTGYTVNTYGVYSAPYGAMTGSGNGGNTIYAFYGAPTASVNTPSNPTTKYGVYLTGEDNNYFSSKLTVASTTATSTFNGYISANSGVFFNVVRRPIGMTAGAGGSIAGGNLTPAAVYKWVVTFVTPTGETGGSLSFGTYTPGAGFNQATTTFIDGVQSSFPIPQGVTGRRIYRTLANGSTYFLVTTINDTTTTAYLDGASDASISGNAQLVNTGSGSGMTTEIGTTTAIADLDVDGIARINSLILNQNNLNSTNDVMTNGQIHYTGSVFLGNISGTDKKFLTTNNVTPTNGQLCIGNGTDCTWAAMAGTINQITVTLGSGTITLSGPQDLATTSNPQFGRPGLGAPGVAGDNLYLYSGNNRGIGLGTTTVGAVFGAAIGSVTGDFTKHAILIATSSNGTATTSAFDVDNNGNTFLFNGTSLAIGTSTFDSNLDVNGSVRFEGNSSVVTASISGAIVGLGCDTANTTSPVTLASTTAFVTTPESYPGNGLTWQSYALNSTTIQTTVCSDVTVTPVASTYVIKIIK